MNKLTNQLSLLFLQDEMEGLDLEGKTVEETTDLLEKLMSTVTVVNQVWLNSIILIDLIDGYIFCYWKITWLCPFTISINWIEKNPILVTDWYITLVDDFILFSIFILWGPK